VFSDVLNNIKMMLVSTYKQLINVFFDVFNNVKMMFADIHEYSPQQALRTVKQIKALHDLP